mgnify:CR=1 FL=1
MVLTYAQKLRERPFAEFDANSTAADSFLRVIADVDMDSVTIEDEDSKFNLNAMGFPGDLGSDGDPRQRFTSFESSEKA